MIAWYLSRGKSGLHWKKNQVTPGERKLRESATEKIPPLKVRVKWQGKSLPLFWQQKWQCKPFLEQGQIGITISSS